jgi:ABC-type multidrug transport system fused ATPase/permease subunit
LLPRASRKLTAITGALVVLSAILPVATAIAVGVLVGSVLGTARFGFGSPEGHKLLVAAAVMTGLFLAQQLIAPCLQHAADALGRRLDAMLSQRVMKATMSPPTIAHLEDAAMLDLVAMTRAVGTGRDTPRDGVVGLAVIGATRARAVGSALLLATFSPLLAVGLLAVFAAIVLIVEDDFRQGVAALRGNPARFRRSEYLRDLTILPPAAKEIRVFGLRQWLGDRFDAEWAAAMRQFREQRAGGRAFLLVSALGIVLGLGGAFVTLARATALGRIRPGEFAMYVTAVFGVASMRQFSIHNVKIRYGSAVVPTVFSLEQATARTSGPGRKLEPRIPSVGVRFERVSFRYPGQDVDVYSDLDLEIPAGRSIAIVGANGAGKTTLVKLLAGLHRPTAGRILVDGDDLAEIEPAEWQRRIGAVFQDFVRYELSAADNVGFGAIERAGDRAALSEAANEAGAAEIINSLPDGWDTVLSRQYMGGTDLSGGQWQRLALARALFAARAGARILILDEPTAALDVRAEATFYDRFLDITRGLTTILISHRFSTVRLADHIVVIEAGKVKEAGSHEDLLAADGDYARMFRLQASHFDDHPPTR